MTAASDVKDRSSPTATSPAKVAEPEIPSVLPRTATMVGPEPEAPADAEEM